MVLKAAPYKYIASKRKPDAFCDYMEKHGWSIIKKSPTKVVIKKEQRKLTYDLEIKRFYAVWTSKTVIYRSIKF